MAMFISVVTTKWDLTFKIHSKNLSEKNALKIQRKKKDLLKNYGDEQNFSLDEL